MVFKWLVNVLDEGHHRLENDLQELVDYDEQEIDDEEYRQLQHPEIYELPNLPEDFV